MTEQTASSIVVEAPPATVMSVIADFASYPLWAKGVKQTDVLESDGDGRALRVRFNLDVPPIRDVYTLDYLWDDERRVSWTLVEATLLRSLDGDYTLRDLGGDRTEVTYHLTLDLQIPLIGMLKRKGERILIDTALRGLKTRVEAGH